MNKKKLNNFYITTPIYYLSGKPHLGHAYTSIACDILARWNRNIGKNVFFQTGTDEHGQKVAKNAAIAKKNPKEFTEELLPEFKKQLEIMNISNDYFLRTTNEDHKKFVQEMLQKSYDNGDIYKGTYEGLYCIDCEQYYKEDELLENNVCPVHKKKVENLKEENYFFKLSKYQNKLLKLYEKNPEFLSPKSKAQETLNRVKEGLMDISISRNKKTLSWGIELPFDKEHVTYVWFDALFNYISGLKINNNFKEFWPANIHVIGKDIMWFHKVYWPAFLMSVDMKIPKKVFAHGWWTVNGEKMGKALGNVINPNQVAQKYGTDEFRYFLMSVGTFGDDLDFSEKLFSEKINNELNNDFGNLVSRVHTMTNKYFEGITPEVGLFNDIDEKYLSKLNIYEKFNSEMQELKFNTAIETLWTAIRETNAYINEVAPWKENNKERLKTIIVILISSIKLFGEYIDCFMPEKAKKLRKQFNIKKENKFVFEIIQSKIKLNEKENLFEKIKIEKNNEDKSNQINKNNNNQNNNNSEKKEGFESLNLKVGKIISIENHPDSDKMYVEKIDLGEEEPRQIVSGLKSYYKLEEMKNKKVIVLCNLKAAKLRGVKSEGMVLVSETKDESQLGLLLSEAKIGTNLESNGKIANSESRVKVENFFKMDFKSDGEKVYFENKEITAEKKSLIIDRKIKGIIC
ncbi:MAG: methionine--tRNA ligase [Nanoarchaeota archaeon]|nr:methionine--tRNA ligase [Nanoarchaeota archaeon]